MTTLILAIVIAIHSGATGHITFPVMERGDVVVAWDSPRPGQGWVHLEHFEDGSYRLDIQREFAPRKVLLKKWQRMHRHAIERAIRAHR